MKKEKGITLVALIVTIIIMLILAGVTITAVVGEGGLMERANRAIQEHEKGEEKEILGLSYAGRYIEYELYDKEITPEEMKEEIKNNGEEARAVLDQENQKNMYITFQKTGNVYSLNIETGEIKHIGKYTGEHDKEDLTEGDIIFSSTPTEITKENVTTSIKVKQEIEMKDYKLEWTRTPLDKNSWQEYKEKITSEKNEVIYARIKDTLTGQTKLQTSIAIKNIDKQEPSGTLEVTEQTTNKVTLQVEANDPETDDYASSGIKGYYYSKDNGTTWSDITTAVRYRFTGLTQGAEYKFKVKIEDNAGNTKEVGTSGNTGLITGIITFGTPQWSTSTANSATVAISGSQSGCELKYTIGNTTDIANWTTISSGTEITVSSGTTIKAALWDGTNAGTTGTKTVRDETAPSIDLKANTTAWAQSVTLTGTATDNESLVTHWDFAESATTARYDTGKGVRTTGSQTKTVSANGTYWYSAKNGVDKSEKKSISVTNIDKAAPTGYIGTSSNTRSVTVSVYKDSAKTQAGAKDQGSAGGNVGGATSSGLADKAYRFSADNGNTWTAWQESSSYKFDHLTQTTAYNIKVEVKDKVGNVGTITGSGATTTVATPTSTDVTYTAEWSATEAKATVTLSSTLGYTIQTSTDGSNWSATNPITISSGEKVYVRYWDKSSETLTDNKNVGAKYLVVNPILKYTVAYNGNGATGGSTGNITYEYNNTHYSKAGQTISSNGYTKTGYTFKEWNTKADGSGTKYSAGASLTTANNVTNIDKSKTATVTLYAQWTANKATIYFYPNGGSAVAANPLITSGTYAGASPRTNTVYYGGGNYNLYDVKSLFTRTGYDYPWSNDATDIQNAQAWRVGSGASTTYVSQNGQNFDSYLTDSTNVVIKLYANWIPNTYTINYYNGSTKVGSSTHAYGTAKKLNSASSMSMSKSGWSFEGWTTSNSATTANYRDTASVSNLTTTNGGTITLYAIWKRNVTFYSGINKATTNTSQVQYYNSKGGNYAVTTPSSIASVTTADGWGTLGWRDDTTAGDKEITAGASTTSNSSTFYAVYSRKVYFYSGISTNKTKVERTQYYNSNNVYNVTTPSTIASVNSSWTALGWRIDTTTNETVVGTSQSWGIGNVRNFYAVYKRTLTVSYNANGGTLQSGKTAPASQTNTQYYNTGGNITSPKFILASCPWAKTGYSFNGWSTSSSATVGTTGEITFAPDVNTTTGLSRTYYAIWKANTYTIQYDLASGTAGSSAPTSATYNKAFKVDNPTRTGYTFNGWNITGMDECIGSYGTYVSETNVNPYTTKRTTTLSGVKANGFFNLRATSGTVKFTAKWTVNTYTLTINANGGTMTSGSTGGNISSYTTKFKYNQVTGFRKGLGGGKNQYAEPVRSGYKFIGWEFSNGTGSTSATDKKSDIYCYAEESGTFWQASESTYYFNGNYAGNVTAKAKWKANTYNLTINPNGGTFTKPGGTALSGNFSTTFTYGSGDQLFCETGYYTSNSSAKWLGAVPYEVSNGCALPKREGYTFNGWKVSGGSISIGDFKGSNGYTCYNYHYKCDYAGNVTITAQWTAN